VKWSLRQFHTTPERSSMPHANAPLTELGRLRLARCVVDDGWPLRRAAERFQVSPVTAKRWADRYRAEGAAGMRDRSSRPHHSPNRTSRQIERKVLHLRRSKRLGPARIGWRLDRATAEPIRRYEHDHPGDLIHVDVKKLGNIPDGGGWRTQGRAPGQTQPHRHTRTHHRQSRPGPGSATPTCTPPWTIIQGRPTPKYSATRPKKPRPGSGGARTPGSPHTRSPSPGSSRTTPATSRGSGMTPVPSSA
jgi:transposase